MKKISHPSPCDFDGLPYPRGKVYSHFSFIKMTVNDVKQITYMPKITFFIVLEGQGKTQRGESGATTHLVRRGSKEPSPIFQLHSKVLEILVLQESLYFSENSCQIYSRIMFRVEDLNT